MISLAPFPDAAEVDYRHLVITLPTKMGLRKASSSTPGCGRLMDTPEAGLNMAGLVVGWNDERRHLLPFFARSAPASRAEVKLGTKSPRVVATHLELGPMSWVLFPILVGLKVLALWGYYRVMALWVRAFFGGAAGFYRATEETETTLTRTVFRHGLSGLLRQLFIVLTFAVGLALLVLLLTAFYLAEIALEQWT